MQALAGATWRAAILGRWTARVLGTVMVLLFLAFFFGEGPPDFSRLTATERLQFVGMGALFLGLAAAWRWEGWGGLVSVAGFALLVAIDWNHWHMWALAVPAAAGAVHLACWIRLRSGQPAGLAPWHFSHNAVLFLVAALGLFLLLCVNEIFGQPPLMTPALHPSATLLGSWTGTGQMDVALTIHADSSVTGTIEGAEIDRAKIAHGRSWFGKLLHVSADYVIRGQLPGHNLAIPLSAVGTRLQGSLFLDGRPRGLQLTKQSAAHSTVGDAKE